MAAGRRRQTAVGALLRAEQMPPACSPRRYQPDELADTSDTITTPRSWHFSSRSDHLDQRRQEELASKCPDAK